MKQKASAINIIWLSMVVLATVTAAYTGKMEILTKASFDSAKDAVTLAIGLIGPMALWLGIMKVAEDGGLMQIIARWMRPLMVRLFPDVPHDHPAMSAMIMNMAANALGLGNAATPMGIKAMQELAKLRQQGLIAHLGLANFDTAHLRVLLNEGIPVASNQVCMSLLDRRGTEDMTALCLQAGVKLLTYGVLGGGFLSERWVGAAAPAEVRDWSKMKYQRFIQAVGGWDALQTVLKAAQTIARKHRVSVSNVATRWVLEQPAVAAVIVVARLGESEHRADNLRPFEFQLDADDHALLDQAFAVTRRLSGDCGDEYRQPPFLTASGDLSHHLDTVAPLWPRQPVPGYNQRWTIDSGSAWEPIAGYSRAVRLGDRILVSGTTATHGQGQLIGRGDAAVQATYILDKIAASIKALGGKLQDVVRTRVYLQNAADCEAVSRVHGKYFGAIRPANTLLEVAALIGEGYLVEIEAEAVLAAGAA